MTTLLQQLADFKERTRQLKAVKAYIDKHGSLKKHQATQRGIPGYGKVDHPGARIFELRHEEGYVIKTDRRPTVWRLISKPKKNKRTAV